MQRQIRNLTLAAMLLALGLVLPLVTGNIPRVGNLLLPMHLPVFLGGLLLGWQYGLLLGAVLPLMRSLLFGMPPLYPVALAMTFELATYGAVAGALYRRSPWKCLRALYRALLLAMFAGRAAWGIAEVALLGMAGKTFPRRGVLECSSGHSPPAHHDSECDACVASNGDKRFVRRRRRCVRCQWIILRAFLTCCLRIPGADFCLRSTGAVLPERQRWQRDCSVFCLAM